MKRVLEVFGEPVSNGGQESFVINVLRHMDMSDMSVDLLTPYYCDNEHYRKIVEELNGKIVALGVDFNPGKSRSNIKGVLTDYLKKNHYDVVHVHSGSISILVYVAQVAKKCGVEKVLVHSHCGVEKVTLKNIVLRTLTARSLKKNADVFCACSQVAGEAKFVPSVTNGNMTILKNGIDFQEFKLNDEIRNSIRKQYGLNAEDLVIGHVGRFSYQKNHEFLIDIFAELKKKAPSAKLMLIGSGELENDIKDKIKQKNLEDSVIMTGNVNNVNEHMQAMDVFLLPSRFEGLPIVGVEAQGAGLPVITSTNVSRELALTDGVKFISLHRTPEEWASVVYKAAKKGKKDYQNELQEAGYDINQTAQQIKSMYFE